MICVAESFAVGAAEATAPLTQLTFAFIGVLIGFLCDLALFILLDGYFLHRQPTLSPMKVVSTVLGTPTTCFAGPWLTSKFFASLDLAAVLPYYAIAVVVTIVLPLLAAVTVIAVGITKDLRRTLTPAASKRRRALPRSR